MQGFPGVLAETLYPNTKIIVSRKKVEGTLLTYTNELDVKVDVSDVDSSLLEEAPKTNTGFSSHDSDIQNGDINSDEPQKNSTTAGKIYRFFGKGTEKK